MVKRIINCPSGHGTMKIEKSAKSTKFRDVEITFHTEYYVCPVCGLEVGSVDQASATQRAISDAYRKAAGLLTSEEIRQGRKKQELSQDALAKQMHVGIASIKRWESGSIQSRSMDAVLRSALGYQEETLKREEFAYVADATGSWKWEPVKSWIEDLREEIRPDYLPKMPMSSTSNQERNQMLIPVVGKWDLESSEKSFLPREREYAYL